MKGKKRKPVKIVLLSVLAAFVLFNAVQSVSYLITGYPLILRPGFEYINRNDPFWQTAYEYEAAVDSILGPLYRVPGSTVKRNLPVEAVQYFLDNDFTDEINALDVIYQKAVLQDEEAKSQRENVKSSRVASIKKMEKSLETFDEAMEIVQKYAVMDKWEFTQEEKLLLGDLVWRGSHAASLQWSD